MGEQRHPLGLVVLGLIAGIVAFVGCFMPFFTGGAAGSIVIPSGGGSWSWWWYFTPILLGLGTLGLMVPRLTVTAILPLGAVGLALGFKSTIDSIDFGQLARSFGAGGGISARFNQVVHSGFGPGPGFFMIVIGGAVLALVWAWIVHDMVVARFGSITEVVAVRSPGAPSPGGPVSTPAPTATPDPGVAPAPDPAPPEA